MKQTFEQYKQAVIQLAKKNRVAHLIPDANRLFLLFEKSVSVKQVVKNNCTIDYFWGIERRK